MVGVEERRPVRHRRVRGDDVPDHVALQLGDGVAVHRRDPGEGVEIVVDQHLPGDGDHAPIGLDAVTLLRLAERAALELAALAHLEKLRRLAELNPVHRLEVGGEHLTAEQREGPRIGLVGLAERLVGDRREDLGEIRGRVQRPRRDLVAGKPARAGPHGLQALTGELHQRHAAVLAGRVFQREQRRAVAVEERVGDGLAAGYGCVAAAQRHRDMAEGPGLVGLCGDLVEDQAARLVDGHTALDQVVGEAALEVQLLGKAVDRGNALALLRTGLGHQRIRVDAAGLLLGLRIGCGLRLAAGARLLRLLPEFGVLRLGRLFRRRVGRVAGLLVGLVGVVHHIGPLLDLACGAAMQDAVMEVLVGAEAGGGIGTHRHGGDLERSPVDGAPKLAAALGLRDLVAVDLVADGDRADVPGLDVAPDIADRITLRDPDPGDALPVLDPRRARHDRADHRIEIARIVHLQERRAVVQPFEPHMVRRHAQLLVMRITEERETPHPRTGRPDHLDAPGLGVNRVRGQLRRPAKRRQFDRLLHQWILVRSRRRPGRPDRSRGRLRPGRSPARCRSW